MTEPDAFHRALAALDVPEDATEVAEMLLAALRNGHDLRQAEPPVIRWGCWRCNTWVAAWRSRGSWWMQTRGTGRSCVDGTREWAARGYATPSARAWLAEQEGASR